MEWSLHFIYIIFSINNIYNITKMYTKEDFYSYTIAVFKGCKRPLRNPDYVSMTKSGTISSEYWYGTNKQGDYVIRSSSHWSLINNNGIIQKGCGRLATCFWVLRELCGLEISCGNCYLKKFKKNLKHF